MAIILGVTQREIENDYYMVDIPKLIRAKAKQSAIRRLEEVRIALATNNRSSEDEDFKSLMNGLTRTAGIENANHFDREKFEQLRMMQAVLFGKEVTRWPEQQSEKYVPV